MLVYGERVHREPAEAMLGRIEDLLTGADAEPLWILRHERIVAALIEAGRLAQGLADAAFVQRGLDAPSAAADAALTFTRAISAEVMASLSHPSSRTPSTGDPGPSRGGWEFWIPALRFAAPGMTVEVKAPEGYAYYALYPETYGLAAQSVRFEEAPAVLGLRSIGTSLAAMVAAGSDAKTVSTARPCGHPFARELKLSEALSAELAAGGPVAVVDEGPGMSGSSFGAAADLLERLGVPAERQWFFPSHLGDMGPKACERHRRRWAGAQRRRVGFEAFVLDQLPAWFEDVAGEAVAPLEELSGGAWRARLGVTAPVHAAQERRKYLLHTIRGQFLLKFSGLGGSGSEKLRRARTLHAAGFAPETLALRHGFLLQRWLGAARPLPTAAVDRDVLLDTVGRYLAFRAARFPAAAGEGAGAGELIDMAAYNAGQLLDAAAGAAVRDRLAPLSKAALSPVRVDGRMHAWEWLVQPDGRLLKADALDHDDAHDLVGCQDVLWDVAGAAVELDFSAQEAERLCRETGADAALLHVFEIAYLAFQAGAWTLALTSAAAIDRPAIGQLVEAYRARLVRRLA